MTSSELFEEIDKMLFEAGNLILGAHIVAADRKITDARIRLQVLRDKELEMNADQADYIITQIKSGPTLDETDPTLLWLLRRAFDEWGAAGVVRAAKLFAESDQY